MLDSLIEKYKDKVVFETNPLVKGIYQEIVRDLRELRPSVEDGKRSEARDSLVKELEAMERRDALATSEREDMMCKYCALPKNGLKPAAGGGVVCQECL
jgi:hypothetical protein